MHKRVWLVKSGIRKHSFSLIHFSKVPSDKLALNSIQVQKYNWCQPNSQPKTNTDSVAVGFVLVSGAGPLPYGILGSGFLLWRVSMYVWVCLLILQTSFSRKANKGKSIHSLLEPLQTTDCWVLLKLHRTLNK